MGIFFLEEFHSEIVHNYVISKQTVEHIINKVEVIPGIFDHEVVYVQVLRTDNKKKRSHIGKYSYMTKQKKQHLEQNITNINLCGSNAKNLTTDAFWINC